MFEDLIINDRGFIGKPPQISYGVCPTLRAESHGNIPKVIIIDDIYNNRDVRVYEKYCPTLRSERFGLKVVKIDG